MKVALVHDFLNQAGGAERVLASLHRIFPSAPIYTTILDPAALWPALRDADIRVSWMQGLPGVLRHFRAYLPLYPAVFDRLRLEEYDLVISSSSAFAKSARSRSDAPHLCYCHNTMRFVYDFDRYVERERFGRVARAALPPLIGRLRRWDVRTADRPTQYLANSATVAERIRRHYGRSSAVVHPPVDTERHQLGATDAPYYLVVSRLIPYKRVDLAVRAFNALGEPLVVIGDGPDRAALEGMAASNVRFTGRLPDEDVLRHYAECRGVIFPGEEDFGLVPLEANASGRPVVAFRRGGALETVIEGRTGVFFDQPTPESLAAAVRTCDARSWTKPELRCHAEQFGEAVFRTRILAEVDRLLRPGERP
jgi:glycosyltransferase involved in cell wall biosynthesis